jgi:hypothetical protein
VAVQHLLLRAVPRVGGGPGGGAPRPFHQAAEAQNQPQDEAALDGGMRCEFSPFNSPIEGGIERKAHLEHFTKLRRHIRTEPLWMGACDLDSLSLPLSRDYNWKGQTMECKMRTPTTFPSGTDSRLFEIMPLLALDF